MEDLSFGFNFKLFSLFFSAKSYSLKSFLGIKMFSLKEAIISSRFLHWNSYYAILVLKNAVIHTLIYRAKNICSTPEIPAKEMDYLHSILLKNNFQDWMNKESD